MHLLVDISPHGYGHVSQTSAVVNELVRLRPQLRVTVRTTIAHEFLQQRFQCDFVHIPVAFDFGMEMANAVDVQINESAVAYREFHADWSQKVAHEAAIMRELKPDLLLANIPYLSLAAAKAAGVPAVAMCCLNWADIYEHFCVEDALSQSIHRQMTDAYNSAEIFLKVQPAMAMPSLVNTRIISPIARIGHAKRCHIAANSNQVDGEKLVMVAMGGMEFRLPINLWPRIPGIRFIVPQAWHIQREDVTPFESLGLPFTDVLASCDAVITKPGYGMFTEAACNGVPVLYVTRRNWPEEACLVEWLRSHAVGMEVERGALQSGNIVDRLTRILAIHVPPTPGATGAVEAAKILHDLLA
jgi:UDP:flavonoid glycosyltransferase YjiC (YdhE family)